jgi:hypothetical protein
LFITKKVITKKARMRRLEIIVLFFVFIYYILA